MKNVIYEQHITIPGETDDEGDPLVVHILLTQEANGLAIWRCWNFKSICIEFDLVSNRNTMIERAVKMVDSERKRAAYKYGEGKEVA